MDDQRLGSIGERIADARKVQGLTQQALALKVPVSLSLLRKIEQGSRDATPAFVATAAKVLGVSVTELTGQPYDQHGEHRDRIHGLIPSLRRALTYWDLPPEGVGPVRPLSVLVAEAEKVAVMRRGAQHLGLAEVLPGLLVETTALAHASVGPERERAFEVLCVLLFGAHSVTYKTGYEDLSAVVEDRITWAAAGSSDPLMGALAAWSRTTSMLNAGSYDIGLRLLARVQAEIDPGGRRGSDDALRISGPLHLRSAILAARSGDGDTAADHLGEARRMAEHLGADGDGGWHQLSFGPSNVGIHEVAAAIELGDGGAAVRYATRLELSPDLPRIRIGHHHVDLSRAYLWATALKIWPFRPLWVDLIR